MVDSPGGGDSADGAPGTVHRTPVPDPRSAPDPLEAGLSTAGDRIVVAERARRIPPIMARVPEVRIGKRWFSILWLLPIGAAGLLLGIAVCQQLRTYTVVQDFIRTYPGTGTFQPAVILGFP